MLMASVAVAQLYGLFDSGDWGRDARSTWRAPIEEKRCHELKGKMDMNHERADQGIIKSTDSDCHPMPGSLGFI